MQPPPMEKLFTLEEANRALVLVSPIVKDLLSKMNEARRIHDAIKTEQAREQMSESLVLESLRKAEHYLNEVEHHMKELSDVGVLLKDLKLGLVDFPCTHEGNIVYLCWMFGEKDVSFWHHTNESYTSRRGVDVSFLGNLVH